METPQSPPRPSTRGSGSGYTRADGEERLCVRFYLTRAQRDALLLQKARAGHVDNSAFLVETLSLDGADVRTVAEDIDAL